MKIVITGSEGLLGKLAIDALKDKYEIVELDKRGHFPVDLLSNDILLFFRGIETVVHFAANPRPWISLEEAKENIDMTWNILEACKRESVNRIVYASSINVYDMNNLYGRERITEETPICPNTRVDWGEKKGGFFYAMSKVICEDLVKSYHQCFGISAINLRFGCITPDNRPYDNVPEDYAVWLSHEDFKEIIKRAVKFEGYASVSCVSDNEENFVDLSYLEKTLSYRPKSNSAKYQNY